MGLKKLGQTLVKHLHYLWLVKWWFFAALLLPLLMFWWFGMAGNYLANCFWEVSVDYQEKALLFHAELATETEVEQNLNNMRQANALCQAKTSKKFLMPKALVLRLTDIITKGKGLP